MKTMSKIKVCCSIIVMLLFTATSWAAGGNCIDSAQINPNAVCPAIYAPVCGCDGNTYSNDCEATSLGVTSFTQGACNSSSTCSASFTYTIVPVGAPGTGVQFANLTYPSNYTLKWDFGDGITFIGSNPFHLYFGNGPFLVSLEVSDGQGCTDFFALNLAFGGNPNFNCVNTALIDSAQPCPLVVMPVCGCDGVTYGNSCEALNYGGVTAFRSGSCNQPNNCSADFTYNVIVGIAGYTVEFYNQSFGFYTSVLWDFGNGITSTDFQPQYTYLANNLPNEPILVSLTITDGNGCNSTFYQVLNLDANSNCRDISTIDTTVNCPFVYDPVCGCDGVTYGNSCVAQLNGLLSWTPGVCGQNGCSSYFTASMLPGTTIVSFYNYAIGNNLKFTWDFGDGNTSNAFQPNYTYADSGQYYVCLLIEDTVSGCTNSSCDFLFIGNAGLYCIDSSRIDFNTACPMVYDPVCGCNGITYDNDCIANASGVISWTKGECGSQGGICNVNFSYVVNNNPSGYLVQFFNMTNNDSMSTDLWEFGDGTTGFFNNPAHIYTTPGVYLVCLTSGNPLCDGIAYCEYIYVGMGVNCYDTTAINPAVLCPQIVDPVCGCDGITYNNSCEAYYVYGISHWTQGPCYGNGCQAYFYYNFDSSAQSIQFYNASWGGFTDVSWSFGDGNTSNDQNPYYTYTNTGTPQAYNVCLSIVNPNTSCYDTYCETIYIDTAFSYCNAGFSWGVGIDSLTGDSVVIFYNNSYAPNMPGQPADVQWVMNDSIMSNDVNVVVPFDSSGIYSVCLTVANPYSNCSDIVCDTVLYRLASSVKENSKALGFVKAYPNPLQNETTVALQLTQRTEVTMQVFDMMGKEIDTIKQGVLNAGNHQFNWNSSKASNGIYYMYVKAGNDSKTIKLSVLK